MVIPLVLIISPSIRTTRFFTNGSVNGQRDPQIHHVSDRVTDNRVGPIDTSSIAVSVGLGYTSCAVAVVEIFCVQAQVFFPHGVSGRTLPGHSPQTAHIILIPVHRHVLYRLLSDRSLGADFEPSGCLP